MPTVAMSSPRDRGPDGPGRVDHRRVEADRVPNLIGPDHLADERLPRGILEAVVQPEDDRENADLPEHDRVGDHEQTERECLDAHQ